MNRELLVNVGAGEIRAALVEHGVLQELQVERSSRRGIVSNIYKGRVARVLPGMQAAFVDIGLARTGFLHASDIARPRSREEGEERPPPPDVRELVTDMQAAIREAERFLETMES